MRRASALVGSLLFLAIAPGTVVGLVPWWITRWRMRAPLLRLVALRLVGLALLAVGLCVLLDAFARFALRGLGTPAPVAPPARLVVSGLYRRVRNPMYLALLAVIVGQALLLGDARLVAYGAAVWLATHAFVLTYEEPRLRRTFGTEYVNYCANVPRWIPRWRAWR